MFAKLLKIFSGHPAPTSRPNNPYIAGNVVAGTLAFVGRSDILQKVENDLRLPQQNAIALYGQRRIGKTSILRELESQLSKEGRYQTVYFDLLGREKNPLQTILNELAITIHRKYPQLSPAWQEKDEFHSWLTNIVNSEQGNKPLVILLDEFDAIDTPQSERVRDEFFHYLREKLLPINPEKLNFIFAIGRNISDFKSAFVLLRTMLSAHVSLLNEKETEQLIRLSESDQTLFWSGMAVKEVWKLTQGHPYLTQLLCSMIWEQLWDVQPTYVPKVTQAMVKELVTEKNNKRLFDRGSAALEWIWDGLPPACKIDTAALAELGNQVSSQKSLIAHLQSSGVGAVIAELETAPRYLKEWDILDGNEEKGYRFRVELFRQWVAQHKPLKKFLEKELGKIRVEAEGYYRQAQQAHESKAFDMAIENLKSALRINPQFVEAYQLLANVLKEANKLTEAQQALEKFHACCPEMARSQLTELLWTQIGTCNNRNEQLKLCEKILEYHPEHESADKKKKEILQWQAKRFEEDEEYEKAVEALQKAGLQQEVRGVQQKHLWKKHGKLLRFLIGFIVGFGISFLISIFSPSLQVTIEWWMWGIALGVVIAVLTVIPLKKTTRKKF